MSDPKKYITLKEAAQISGYAPDYLGQLIRKGKLEGKQIYLNVAWVTTEKALREYLDKNKTVGGRSGQATSIKERVRRWVRANTTGEKIIVLARRVLYVFIVILMLFCLFLAYAFIANLFGSMNAHAAAGVPKVLSYQGRLFDSNGNLLGGSGTQYCFRFSIYDGVATGSRLWPNATPTAMAAIVKNGVFNVGVGDTNAGGDALTYDFQSTDTVYLNVEVATKIDPVCTGGSEVFETLSPRERIVASGYAINSYSVGGFTAAQNASGSQIPVLASGNLVLGGTNPQVNATGTNTLTLQGGTGTGAIQFFNANNFVASSGALTIGNKITGSMLQTTATTSQFIFQGVGATGTLSWTPTVAEALTIPNFGTATDTVVLVNFAQALANKTLLAPAISSSTITSSTINNATLNSPVVFAGMSVIQNAAGGDLILTQNSAGTALAITNAPTSTQASSTVSITAGSNVSGAALLVSNFGSGNAIQVNDASSTVFAISGLGNANFRPSVDTTTAFTLSNASGTTVLFTVDTLNNQIKIGDNSPAGTAPTLLGMDIKADAGDPTGFDGAMYYSSSTDRFRCFQGGQWLNCVPNPLDYQQHFITSRWGYWVPLGMTQTTFSAVGMTAPNTAVGGGGIAAEGQPEDNYLRWTSSASNGAMAGVSSTFTAVQMRYTPRLATRIRTDTSIASRRIWFALSSSTIINIDSTNTVFIGLRYSTSAGDTTWKCGSADGTASSFVDTGVPVTTSTYYTIILDGTTAGQLDCMISVNGGNYVDTIKSTNISTGSSNLSITDMAISLAASAVVHRSSFVYLGGKGN